MVFQKGHKLNIGNQFAKGKKHSEEWKRAQSERMKGHTHGFQKGQPSPRKGKKATKPSHWKGKKLPYPIWNKGLKGYKSGEEHYNWKGGVILRDKHSWCNPEYVEWRSSIFERDGFKCQLYSNECSPQIEAHHILPWRSYEESRFDLSNGITLCKFHHPRKRIEEKRLEPLFRKIVDRNILHSGSRERTT